MRIKVTLPMYGIPIIVHVGRDAKEAYVKEVKRHFPEVDENNFTRGEGMQCGSFIWMEKVHIGTLAHEVSHYIDDALEHLGIKDDSGEVRAYMMGWLIGKLWPKIKDGV